ncbi:FAD-binding oxidoreductase [Nocardia thailandica]
MPLSRRTFLAAPALAYAAATAGAPRAGAAQPEVVTPGHPDYAALTQRGYNRRFTGSPDRVFLPADAEEVRAAVGIAAGDSAPIAVRAGGHGFADLVDDARNRTLLDLGRLREVRWDSEYRAFSVDAGAQLGPVTDRLLNQWGVTLPAGICRGVGAGGHFSGGGYGPLSRRFGLVADHLHGVEVVTVDTDGRARLTVATADGPETDLWWAHTGGRGGNFGVVTRYLLRSRDSDGADPARALPTAPGRMLHTRLLLPVATADSFVRFVGNYLRFFAAHSAPDDPFTGLYAPLHIRPGFAGPSDVLIILDADRPGAHDRLTEFVAALADGVFPGPVLQPVAESGYGDTVSQVYYAAGMPGFRVKAKAAYLRRPLTDDQLATLHRYLADLRFLGESQLEFLPFGGAVNSTAEEATAFPVRDSFMTMLIHAAWRAPQDDERHLAWARGLFGDVFASTGGVPVPGEDYGGCYINYPDPDIADPRWNTSGVPWHAFYYRANYERLRRIKARWDPGTVFQHRLSLDRA